MNETQQPQKDTSPRQNIRTQKKPSATKRFFSVVAVVVLVGVSYVAGTMHGQIITGVKGLFGEEYALDTSSLQETYRALRSQFDGDIDTAALIDGANKGMVDALGDDYTSFMTQSEADEFNKSLSGDIGGGIGVEVGLRNDQPTVLRVLRDNPAEKAGVRVGDVFIKVNNESVVGQTVSEVVSKVRGDAGTTVQVTFFRSGEEVDVSITRERVTNPSVHGAIKDGIGTITISRFDNETGSLARQLARQFKDASVKGVVLDMRGNGGGYVDAAKAVSSIWLNDKIIVVEKAGGRVIEEVRSGSDAILDGVPTVVLVDESSASASEIVAGALRDHKAATLVGETTFGKGSVQRLMNLSGGSMLKVTIARWYTPGGLNISEKGITPDTVIQKTADDTNKGRDPQQDAAVKMLK